jgi:hypothetical protein
MYFTRSLLLDFLLGSGSGLHHGPERLGRFDHVLALEAGEVEDAEDVSSRR